MDTRVEKYMEERPLGHAIVKISELCKWGETEALLYDFQQIVGDSYQFVQAELLFPLVSYWSTQHITPQAAQGIMAKKGSIMAGHPVADQSSLSMWAVTAGSHNSFERLFYQAIKAGKIRLIDGITRMPINGLPPESLARFAEVGGDDDGPASMKEDALPVSTSRANDLKSKAQAIAQRLGEEQIKKTGAWQVNSTSICKAVAEELAKDNSTHGRQGHLDHQTVRTTLLKGWKFTPPKREKTDE